MREIGLVAVGDVCLQAPGDRYPFTNVENVLGSGDVLFGNLRDGVVESGGVPAKGLPDPHGVGPREAPRAGPLLRGQRREQPRTRPGSGGLPRDLGHAEEERHRRCGSAGSRQRHRPRGPWTGADCRLGFLAFTERGLAWCWRSSGPSDVVDRRILDDVRAAGTQCDLLVVSLHWGVEGASYPSPRQIRLGRQLVDAGASVVLGHHPHVVQGIERYRGGLIAYSLGNFQFPPDDAPTDETFVLSVRLGRDGVLGYELTPVRIGNDGIPVPAADGEREVLLERVARLSGHIQRDRMSEDEWFSRIARIHLLGNLEAWGIRVRRYGAFEVPRFLLWCLHPFSLRCVFSLPRRVAPPRRPGGSLPSALAGGARAAVARGRSSPRDVGLTVVEEAQPSAIEAWHGYEGASPFVTSAWLEALRGPGRSPIYLRFVERGETVGAMGGLRVGPRFAPLRGLRAAHGLFFFSGPVVPGLDGAVVGRCVDGIFRFADARNIPSVVLGSWDYPVSYLPNDERFERTTRQEYFVDLRGGRRASLGAWGESAGRGSDAPLPWVSSVGPAGSRSCSRCSWR